MNNIEGKGDKPEKVCKIDVENPGYHRMDISPMLSISKMIWQQAGDRYFYPGVRLYPKEGLIGDDGQACDIKK
jgi:hypothetical protein